MTLHPTSSRYAQIALTYTRPLTLRVALGFAVAYLAWIFCIRQANFSVQFSMLFIGGSLAAWGGPIITSHAKEQLADWRSRLTPGFRTPHLVVAAILFLVTVIGIPWVTMHRLNHLPTERGWPDVRITLLGFLAIVAAATVLLAWMAHSQSLVFIFLVMGSIPVVAIARGREVMNQLVIGQRPALAALMLVASAGGLIALWWRLGHMHEEMSEFWKTESFNMRLRVSMTGDRYMRRAAALETGWLNAYLRGARRLDSLKNIFAAPFWSRVQRWRLVIGSMQADWTTPLFVAGGLAAVYYLADDTSKGTDIGLLLVIPALISLAVPSLGTALVWPHRWFVLGGESLRPAASRSAFLREQGAAMLLEIASLWFWFTIGSFLLGLILRPGSILSVQMAGTLVLVAASQILLFGVNIWVLHLRMNWFLNFAATLISLVGAGALVAWQISGRNDEMIRTPSPIWAVLMLVVGVALIWDAYHRWLRTDLD